jgi:hypothetical protein
MSNSARYLHMKNVFLQLFGTWGTSEVFLKGHFNKKKYRAEKHCARECLWAMTAVSSPPLLLGQASRLTIVVTAFYREQ